MPFLVVTIVTTAIISANIINIKPPVIEPFSNPKYCPVTTSKLLLIFELSISLSMEACKGTL